MLEAAVKSIKIESAKLNLRMRSIEEPTKEVKTN